METDTIIGPYADGPQNIAAYVEDGMRVVTPAEDKAVVAEGQQGARPFKIRAADEEGHRSSANILVERRYAWRGYGNASLPQQTPNRITLSATESDVAIGTITVGLDGGAEAIYAESVFPEEVAELRRQDLKLCEFTKLAMDPVAGSRRVLASLFHVAYIIAHRLRGYDMLLLEVNPRHVGYYRRMLGCRVLGAERLNERVSAPSVLLGLEFTRIREQIEKFGGRPELATVERSLYPYAFSGLEEIGIIGRFRASNESPDQTVH